jgi:hypothetical protein
VQRRAIKKELRLRDAIPTSTVSALNTELREMAADQEGESVALEWAEGTVADAILRHVH